MGESSDAVRDIRRSNLRRIAGFGVMGLAGLVAGATAQASQEDAWMLGVLPSIVVGGFVGGAIGAPRDPYDCIDVSALEGFECGMPFTALAYVGGGMLRMFYSS